MPKSPGELWYEAGEDPDRFRELMREAGYLIECECPCHLRADRPGHCDKCKPQLPCGWPGGTRG